MKIFESILLFFAGLGVFLFGMKVISENLERTAGKNIQKLFDKVSNNKYLGVGIGMGATAIVQSSSATTVMVLGFVNAGLMTLYQATTIIMGANIGTTMTAIIVSLKFLPIGSFFMAFSLIGAIMLMFSKKSSIKLIGGILMGLGLIFVGLELMSIGMEFLRKIDAVLEIFNRINNPFVLFLIGAIFTALIQSSSASTSIVITLVSAQVMSLDCALYVVLGTNLGTCITTFLATIGASTNTLRTAVIHLMFNLIGAVVFFPILLLFESSIISGLTALGSANMVIAYFHVIFNVCTTIILLPFTRQFVNFIQKIIPEKKQPEAQPIYHLEYLDERLVNTPSLAISQLMKEIKSMTIITKNNLNLALDALCQNDLKNKDLILENENKIDFLTRSITDYAIKVSGQHLTDTDETIISSIYHIVTDLERIGDHAKNFLDFTTELEEKKLVFSSVAIADIQRVRVAVFKMIDICEEFYENQDLELFDQLYIYEAEVDSLKDTLTESHISRLNAKKCTVDTGAIFFGVLTDLERVGDHITNICSSIHPSIIKRRKIIRKKINLDGNLSEKSVDKHTV